MYNFPPGGNTYDSFKIDETTGDISLAKQVVGYNEIPQYELIINAVDGGFDPSPLTGTATVLVKIHDSK